MVGLPVPATAGFVLAGGRSSRMGRDKALLPLDGEPLVARIARRVAAAAGSVAIVGPADRYASLGFEVVPDRLPGAGPLGGIDTALALGRAKWNLVVACDLPAVAPAFLAALLERAQASHADCVMPRSDRPEPLCAVYSLSAAIPIRAALSAGIRKVTQALTALSVDWYEVDQPGILTNLNTPHDWEVSWPIRFHTTSSSAMCIRRLIARF